MGKKSTAKKILSTSLGMAMLAAPASADKLFVPIVSGELPCAAICNQSSTDKTLTITIRDSQGQVVNETTKTISAWGQINSCFGSGDVDGSMEISSDSGSMEGLAFNMPAYTDIMVAGGITQGACHNLIHHATYTEDGSWVSTLMVSNVNDKDAKGNDLTVKYTITLVGQDGTTLGTLSKQIGPNQSASFNVETLLNDVGSSENVAQIKIDADNPLAAGVRFKHSDYMQATAIGEKYASDYEFGSDVYPVNDSIIYVDTAGSDKWVGFPSTFTLHQDDKDRTKVGLNGYNRLTFNGLSSQETKYYVVKTHTGEELPIIIIGDKPTKIDDPSNYEEFSTQAGNTVTVSPDVSESDGHQYISKINIYDSNNNLMGSIDGDEGSVDIEAESGQNNYTLEVLTKVGEAFIKSESNFSITGTGSNNNDDGGNDDDGDTEPPDPWQ